MSSRPRTPWTAACSVLTCTAVELTVTTDFCAPTSSRKFPDEVTPTCTVMVVSRVLNPTASTRKAYSQGNKAPEANMPLAFVANLLLWPVSFWVMVTAALGTAAPLGSVMVPWMLPDEIVVWALSGEGQ